jgi:tellurite resistance protein
MAENSYLKVIQVWAALAWADGKMVKAEQQALERLIASAELSDGERTVALGFVEHKVMLDPRELGGLSKEAREGVYRAACKLAAIDRHVAEAERTMLVRMRSVIGVDDVLAEKLEREAGL